MCQSIVSTVKAAFLERSTHFEDCGFSHFIELREFLICVQAPVTSGADFANSSFAVHLAIIGVVIYFSPNNYDL